METNLELCRVVTGGYRRLQERQRRKWWFFVTHTHKHILHHNIYISNKQCSQKSDDIRHLDDDEANDGEDDARAVDNEEPIGQSWQGQLGLLLDSLRGADNLEHIRWSSTASINALLLVHVSPNVTCSRMDWSECVTKVGRTDQDQFQKRRADLISISCRSLFVSYFFSFWTWGLLQFCQSLNCNLAYAWVCLSLYPGDAEGHTEQRQDYHSNPSLEYIWPLMTAIVPLEI